MRGGAPYDGSGAMPIEMDHGLERAGMDGYAYRNVQAGRSEKQEIHEGGGKAAEKRTAASERMGGNQLMPLAGSCSAP